MSERPPSSRRIATVVTVVISTAVVVSLIVVAVYYGGFFAGLGFGQHTTTRNSDAYQVTAGYSVVLSGGSVNLNVVQSSNETVFLTVTAISSSLLGNQAVNITSTFTGNSVNLTVVTPKTGLIRSTATLYLPVAIAAGAVSVGVTNGNVVMNEPSVSGTIDASTSNGNIQVTTSISDNIHLLTNNGNINFVSQSFLNLTAITQNGNINFQVLGSVILPGSTSLTTSNGNINIEINQGQSVSVDAHTSYGQVSVSGLQFTVSAVSSRAFTGVLGAGEATLNAATTNGNIGISS